MRHLPQVQNLRGTHNSAFAIKDILMQCLKNNSDCKEIHDEQNRKSLSEDQVSVTESSVCLRLQGGLLWHCCWSCLDVQALIFCSSWILLYIHFDILKIIALKYFFFPSHWKWYAAPQPIPALQTNLLEFTLWWGKTCTHKETSETY